MINLPAADHTRTGMSKDAFMRSVIREMAGILESTVGTSEAAAYVNHVGLLIGRELNREYRESLKVDHMDIAQVAATLVDLKAKIDGEFSVESLDETSIVLVNTACPFGDRVSGRTSLCRMTANVFGHVSAENLGYARVGIDEAIARGDPRCKVTITLTRAKTHPREHETDFFSLNDKNV